ncbi:glycosyltransferase family 2 protein [Pedobacter yonginense]|uniref:Glycosyltransferase family 2 protein n=1 Tax=Pedobacter yonginense TaxID=651869 RepID=A0A317EKP2_9SPHI|nr:glycosyltransferase family 2 protein [Pedobacter yonginense]PWS27242.1 glycosyltransferase family 2 protein [Pedobacter yonginense]
MHKNFPLVSIALCTYNGEKFLRQQLESILQQTYKNIEVIIIDDCSTDNTAAIINEYAQEYHIIKFLQNERNLGFSKNFEKAIESCTGEYLCLSDQDDIWEKNKVEQLYKNIDNHALIYHDSDFIDESDQRIGEESMFTRYNMYEGSSALPLILSNCISGHATMFSKKLLPYLLPFDKRFYHDWWLAYVAFNIGSVKYLNQILVHYRQHESSITDNLNIKVKSLDISSENRIAVNLNWLEKCSLFVANKEPILINKAFTLFSNIQKGKSRVELFLFIITYYDLLFHIISKPKGLLSKINYARKIAFSINPPFRNDS